MKHRPCELEHNDREGTLCTIDGTDCVDECAGYPKERTWYPNLRGNGGLGRYEVRTNEMSWMWTARSHRDEGIPSSLHNLSLSKRACLEETHLWIWACPRSYFRWNPCGLGWRLWICPSSIISEWLRNYEGGDNVENGTLPPWLSGTVPMMDRWGILNAV